MDDELDDGFEDELDDWMLDDWEDEELDEDVHDVAELEDTEADRFDDEADMFAAGTADELETEAVWHVETVHEPRGLDGGGGGLGTAGAPATGGERMGWSAWDVGTVFAIGGWMADQHADRTARQVAAALAERDISRPAGGRPLGADQPPPASGFRYDTAAPPLVVGAALAQGSLFADLHRATTTGADLMIQAQGPGGPDGALLLVISAVPSSSGPRLWVVAEEHPGGFSATRLVPVFVPERNAGLAVFATDHATEAADAAAWACGREGVALDRLTVTHRR
jgi:hypothetical protein